MKKIRVILSMLGFHVCSLFAEPQMGERHIVLMDADLENIYATYYFAIRNEGEEGRFEGELPIFVNTFDFKPSMGLREVDLKLSDGRLFIQKTFPPGVHLMGVDFYIRRGDQSEISFKAPYDLGELSFALTSKSSLSLKSSGFREGIPAMLDGQGYKGILSETKIGASHLVSVQIEGLPQGRGNLIRLSLGFAFFLFLGLFFYLYQTKKGERKSAGEI